MVNSSSESNKDGSTGDQVEDLFLNMQIDMGHSAVLNRIKSYKESYIARIAEIHMATVAELKDMQIIRQDQEQEALKYNENILNDKALLNFNQSFIQKTIDNVKETDQRKLNFIDNLEKENLRLRERVIENNTQYIVDETNASLLCGIKKSYNEFSSALDDVLEKLRSFEDVAIPTETSEDLNNTLELCKIVVQDNNKVTNETLNLVSEKVTQGISVLHHIKNALDEKKSQEELSNLSPEQVQDQIVQNVESKETAEVAYHETPSSAQNSSTGFGHGLSKLAVNNPKVEESLNSAFTNFDQLREIHDNVQVIADSFVSAQNNELRQKLLRGISIVNTFNDDNPSNKRKLVSLISIMKVNHLFSFEQ